ncbi:hypothetical protein PENSPDRAFT_738553 [Peniophora sp. CONT]|nr:hypothetical protein PENSPDRAFT_738553 [Peniophora sp. CONT]
MTIRRLEPQRPPSTLESPPCSKPSMMTKLGTVAQRRGWLPPEIWVKIVDEHAPPLRLNAMMETVPTELDDTFDPYTLYRVSCVDFNALHLRQVLAGVNRQLRVLLHGTYLHPRDCLVVTNDNAHRLRQGLEKASTTGEMLLARHVAFILHLSPGAGPVLDAFARIMREVRGVEGLSFGVTVPSGCINNIDVTMSNIAHFTESLQLRNDTLCRVAFLDGACILSTAWDAGTTERLGWEILKDCNRLQSLSFHRHFYRTELQSVHETVRDAVWVLGPKSTPKLNHLILDSPHVRYVDDQLKGINALYIRDEGQPNPYVILSINRLLNAGLGDDTIIRSPVSHISLGMSARSLDVDMDFVQFRLYASSLRNIRLSAPLSQLTSSVPLLPASVRSLVLVIDNNVSWNTQVPPSETVAWERIHSLVLSIKHAKRHRAIHLERVQFAQGALAERIRSELAVHVDVRQEIEDVGVTILDERNKPL